MKKLIEWRKAKNLNMSQAAKNFGVNRSTWKRWEDGTEPVGIKTVKRLSNLTGIPMQEIRPDIY